MSNSTPMLSARFDSALVMAAQLHAKQSRKVSNAPYISHLLAVCAIALEHGADEDQAIAALLHDAVEDQGGRPTLERIERHFGRHVAAIVTDCTDNLAGNHASWRARKEAYIDSIEHKSKASYLVIAADKFHNASSIVSDIERHGAGFFDTFAGKAQGVAWYYQALSRSLQCAYPSALCDRLVAASDDIVRLATRAPHDGSDQCY